MSDDYDRVSAEAAEAHDRVEKDEEAHDLGITGAYEKGFEDGKRAHSQEFVKRRLKNAYEQGFVDGKLAHARERAKRLKALMPMHKGYMTWWVAIMGAIIAADFLQAPPWVWGILLLTFGTVEGIAIRRQLMGDTFSELMWTVRAGAPNRRWLAYGVAIYLPLQFVRIGIPWIPYWAPRLVLGAAFTLWLIPHFNRLGRGG